MKAKWNDIEIANSTETVVVEGNHYFPPESVNREFLRPSNTHTSCPWKGEAGYYDLVVGSDVNRDAAWFYPDPKPAASEISGYVAFWRGVEVSE